MLLNIFILLAVLCFISFSAYKAWKFASMPIHSRLDLYPVPKEAGRAEYGGSYYEEPEWWAKPRKISYLGELKDMLLEMLFIKKLFVNQRQLWWASYSFHLGIYCLFGWTFLLIISSIWPVPFLIYLTSLAGIVGFLLALFGNITLLLRRIFIPTLQKYTTPQEYFNLILILAVLVSGLAAWFGDWLFVEPRLMISRLLSWQALDVQPTVTLHLLLLSFMFIYIPLSKMSHYVGKYFTFHKILWENEPNLPGSTVEKELREAAAHPPQTTWSAPHISQKI